MTTGMILLNDCLLEILERNNFGFATVGELRVRNELNRMNLLPPPQLFQTRIPMLRTSYRSFTTFSPLSEGQAESSRTGFGALKNIFSPNPSSSATPSDTPTHTGFLRPSTPTLLEARRGYDPRALPPKIDPTVEMFTNLLMKHGRKAEAQSKVSRILSML